MSLTWTKNKAIAKYKVYVSSKSKETGFKKVATLKGSKTSYTITKVGKKKISRKKKYYVKIVPYVKDGKKAHKSDSFVIYSPLY